MFTPASVADMVASIANELGNIVQTTATQAGADPGVVTEIQQGIDGLRQAATALSQAENTGAAQPILQRIGADVNAILGALALLPLPPPASVIIRIVQVLAPTVLAAGNIIWPPKQLEAAQRFAAQHFGQGAQEGQQGGQEPQQEPQPSQQPQPDQPPSQPAQPSPNERATQRAQQTRQSVPPQPART